MNRHMRGTLFGAGLLLLAAGCSPESTTRLSGTVAEVNERTVSILPATGEGLRSFTLPGDSGTKALLPGAPVDVEYRGTYREGVEAIRIKTDTTYMEAVGSWTVPDPIAPDSAMGFELRTEGHARSIRMATLCYHGWSLTGERGKILLTGESIGNGQTIPFTETGLIARGADGRLTLVIEGSSLRYVKEEE